jgi:spoIIIJ-associated protein
MEWVVTTGRTVEDAVDHALDQLGVDENEIEYEVVDEGAKGLLGRFGARPARIRARVRPVSREKPDTRRRRRRAGGREGDEGAGSGSDASDQPGRRSSGRGAEGAGSGSGSSERPGSDRPGRRPGGESGRGVAQDRPPRGGGRSSGNGTGSGAGAGSGPGSEDRRRARSGSGGRREASGGAESPERGDNGRHEAQRPAGRPGPRARGSERQATVDDEERTMSEPVDLEDQARVATEFVEGLTRVMKLPGTVTAQVTEDDVIHVDVRGDDLGLLIGPRGATIEAIHELVKSALQRHTGGQGGRVSVDVAGYREKRRLALEAFVQGVAAKALESGRDQVLDPMNSADRKVVHDAVATIDGVVSESQGEEPRRRVVIKRA